MQGKGAGWGVWLMPGMGMEWELFAESFRWPCSQALNKCVQSRLLQPATETETDSESESEPDAETVLDPEREAKRELKFEKFCYQSPSLSGKLLY